MWYQFSAGELEAKLQTSLSAGLSDKEAAKRLKEAGENRIPEGKPDSLLLIFVRQFQSPLIFILLAAGAVILLLGEPTDALVIFFVLLFNAIVGTVQEGRAQQTLSALRQFVQTNATALRSGKEMIVPDTELVPGDIVILQEGEKIPTDARVMESHTLSIDEAALTGESHPTHKTADQLKGENLALPEQTNMVFKGTYVVAGNGRAMVTATGTETIIGKISQTITHIDTEIPLKANVRHLSRLILAAVAIIVTLLFLGGIAAGKETFEMFKIGVSLSVSIIPEGLPIVLTIVLVGGVYRMARRNALVKRLQAVEALGQTRVIAVDKTGTITKNELVVKKLWVAGKAFDVSGSGYDPSGEIKLENEVIDPLNHEELLTLGKIAAFCANARVAFIEKTQTFKVAGDPTEAALLVFAQKVGFNKATLEHETPLISEIPFHYENKYHATSHRAGGMQFIAVTGAPEAILAFSTHTLKGGKREPFRPTDRAEAEEIFFRMSSQGLRVVACAMAELPLEKEFRDHHHLPALTFVGFYGMQDGLREEVAASIAEAQEAGIKVILITGDHKVTASAIAKEAGIYKDGDHVLTGHDIETLSEEKLIRLLDATTVFARVTPEDKLKIIRAYKKKGEIIAMTGDGINDAPSLVAADLGVAMGKIGTEVAKEASDIVLLDDNFKSIVAAIEEGRSIYKTIKKVILYLFSTSVGETLTIAGALALGYPLPILAAQILWLNLVTDGFLDVALAMEPKEQGLLKRTFERPKKYLIDSLMVQRMFVMAIPMMIGTLLLFREYFPSDLPKALTVSLTALAVFQWFNAWNCRFEEKSIFKTNPLANPYLIAATLIIICLHLLAVYTPFMQHILHTVPLNLYDWTLIVLVACTIVLAEEVRKLFYRREYV